MKKSILAILILAMLCPIAAACSSGGATTETQAPVTEGAPAETNAPETDAETAEPKFNPYEDLPVTPAEIDALIASIPGAELAYVNDIDRAYYACCQLSDADRAKVTGYEALLTYRNDMTKQFVVKEYMSPRVPHDKFLLGACVFRNADEEHVKQLSDCLIDFIWPAAGGTEALDLYQKYHIGAMGTAAEHPTTWGIDLGDEPGAERFPRLKELVETARVSYPECTIYCNLFPNYADPRSQLESFNYKTYIEEFIKYVESDFICFDHYCQSASREKTERTLKQFQIVGDAAIKSGRDMWFIAQNFQNVGAPEVTIEFLRYQAYISMAYGCKSVMWACWSEANWGRHGTDVLDENGNLNPIYYDLMTVNTELKALEPIYMRYTGASNAILLGKDAGFDMNMKRYAKEESIDTLTQTTITDITGSDKDLIVVGHFNKNVGDGEAFFFVDSTESLYEDKTRGPAVATFKTVDPTSIVVAYVRGIPTLLEPDETGVYTVEIHGADAVFVTVD